MAQAIVFASVVSPDWVWTVERMKQQLYRSETWLIPHCAVKLESCVFCMLGFGPSHFHHMKSVVKSGWEPGWTCWLLDLTWTLSPSSRTLLEKVCRGRKPTLNHLRRAGDPKLLLVCSVNETPLGSSRVQPKAPHDMQICPGARIVGEELCSKCLQTLASVVCRG